MAIGNPHVRYPRETPDLLHSDRVHTPSGPRLGLAPPTPQPLESLGLFDVDTWICPVENLTEHDTNDTTEDWASLRYRMRVWATRGRPAATGTNFAGHDAVCPTRLRRGTECEFDTDCATCHDGSDCGTITTRQSVIDGGETCRLPDAAECESYRERCCNGRCTDQPY